MSEYRSQPPKKPQDKQNGTSKTQEKLNILQPKTFGPVSDLERHLPTDWWRTLFNALYLKTDGDVVENPENTKRDIDMVIKYALLEPNDNILDLCCGQGRHSLELARRGFSNVVGIDRSRYLIRQAKKRSRQEKLKVDFHEGDARKFRINNKNFHCVLMMGNSFGYFERESDDVAILKKVSQVLVPNGNLILDIVDGAWMGKNFESRSWEWIDQNHFVCRERAMAKDGRRIITREVITHAEKGIIADQFYAERLYTSEQITDLLYRLGFKTVKVYEHIESESTRNQDLGMMGHRLFLTAEAPKKEIAKVSVQIPYRKITVLLGDPELPDDIKLNGKFNENDLETIERMKQALEELHEYEFTYRDNHQNLIKSLVADPPQFVFNLCDEGYLNNALSELHVPSILEMLNIPYSGAGPACLGLCYNKNLVNSIAQSLDIPVPMESYVSPDDNAATLPSVFPALLKPNLGDSSEGITQYAVVYTADELLKYMDWMRKTLGPRPILVQEYLTGPEYSVAVIGNPGLTYKILPPLEVDYSKLDPKLPKILSYESKWDPSSPYWTDIKYKPAELDDDAKRRLIDYSNVLFERLGCRDYARFDFRCDESGNIKLLEVNPNPGWCWDGKMNIMAGFKGLRYADFLNMIIKAAQERISSQKEISEETQINIDEAREASEPAKNN